MSKEYIPKSLFSFIIFNRNDLVYYFIGHQL